MRCINKDAFFHVFLFFFLQGFLTFELAIINKLWGCVVIVSDTETLDLLKLQI